MAQEERRAPDRLQADLVNDMGLVADKGVVLMTDKGMLNKGMPSGSAPAAAPILRGRDQR